LQSAFRALLLPYPPHPLPHPRVAPVRPDNCQRYSTLVRPLTVVTFRLTFSRHPLTGRRFFPDLLKGRFRDPSVPRLPCHVLPLTFQAQFQGVEYCVQIRDKVWLLCLHCTRCQPSQLALSPRVLTLAPPSSPTYTHGVFRFRFRSSPTFWDIGPLPRLGRPLSGPVQQRYSKGGVARRRACCQEGCPRLSSRR